jgi:hypothetical protein
MMGNRPPHTFRPGLASSPMHQLMSTPSSIWLLFILMKRQPPKAKAPPLSLLFVAFYLASPSKQTNDSERNPNSSRPAHGIGERRRHDLVTTALPMEREGTKLLEGRVAWLILLVVVSVCVVFCVLCSNWRPDDCTFFFSGRNFFQFCNNWCSFFDTTDGYLRLISTVGQTTVPFFGGVVIFSGCNLNPPKYIAGQKTVPFFR